MREELSRGFYEPLPLGGTLIEIDTTDFERVDYEGLLQAARRRLRREVYHTSGNRKEFK